MFKQMKLGAQFGSQNSFIDLLKEQDNDGNTPLHLSVDNGHLHVTDYIIDEMKRINILGRCAITIFSCHNIIIVVGQRCIETQ